MPADRRYRAARIRGADEWAAAATAAAESTGIALDVHRVGRADSFTDTTGGFCAAYGIGSTGLVLVRPDGVVAWRASDETQVAAGTVVTALTSALGHAELPRAAEPAVHS
ncbi:hypothetical protein QRX50_16320 [Amycolatopsis carbonis]|uniref:Uncharacterized protein n=1 Tax=Amycolatopsis carbonis TaxID=715471 RepID=A0A9Y2IKU8_9PSEU|nr:hypothetical protein [Amycolatopsis sp. 2-15]WIX82205.1 hypothetical protein QRX50_16320 [Amycolatopsis sp. 2-15]